MPYQPPSRTSSTASTSSTAIEVNSNASVNRRYLPPNEHQSSKERTFDQHLNESNKSPVLTMPARPNRRRSKFTFSLDEDEEETQAASLTSSPASSNSSEDTVLLSPVDTHANVRKTGAKPPTPSQLTLSSSSSSSSSRTDSTDQIPFPTFSPPPVNAYNLPKRFDDDLSIIQRLSPLTMPHAPSRSGPKSAPALPTPSYTPPEDRPILRRSNGSIVKPSLKSSSSTPHMAYLLPSPATTPRQFKSHTISEPSTPSLKAVHFAEKEKVVLFEKRERPNAVSGGAPARPRDDTETETERDEYPFPFINQSSSLKNFNMGSSSTGSGSSSAAASGKSRIIIAHGKSSVIPGTYVPGSRVHIESATLSAVSMQLTGTLLVQNVAFEKQVYVRFTLDDWMTTSEVMASWVAAAAGPPPRTSDPNQDGGCWDRFSYSVSLADIRALETRRMYLVARYVLPSWGWTEFWDNNQGRNYMIVFERETAASASRKASASATGTKLVLPSLSAYPPRSAPLASARQAEAKAAAAAAAASDLPLTGSPRTTTFVVPSNATPSAIATGTAAVLSPPAVPRERASPSLSFSNYTAPSSASNSPVTPMFGLGLVSSPSSSLVLSPTSVLSEEEDRTPTPTPENPDPVSRTKRSLMWEHVPLLSSSASSSTPSFEPVVAVVASPVSSDESLMHASRVPLPSSLSSSSSSTTTSSSSSSSSSDEDEERGAAKGTRGRGGKSVEGERVITPKASQRIFTLGATSKRSRSPRQPVPTSSTPAPAPTSSAPSTGETSAAPKTTRVFADWTSFASSEPPLRLSRPKLRGIGPSDSEHRPGSFSGTPSVSTVSPSSSFLHTASSTSSLSTSIHSASASSLSSGRSERSGSGGLENAPAEFLQRFCFFGGAAGEGAAVARAKDEKEKQKQKGMTPTAFGSAYGYGYASATA